MLKYILVIVGVLAIYVIIFALFKVASNFDDEVEELYTGCYDDDGLDESYDYYEEKYKK